MGTKRALVLSGTGMLTGCVERLVANGWYVVLPSRHYAPLPADHDTATSGRARWVEADWAHPRTLATRARRTLGAPADLLITWIHADTRTPTLRAIAPLLAPHAPVVEACTPHNHTEPTVLKGHPLHQVILAPVGYAGRTRWPSPTEITEEILNATRRALTHP
ncbi:hypothetical protein [Actinokineospora inagensis]|uniref:hypothetical protein n=1 Tax=Actinokineospora inagensis TaxID=103730 RepID=UPI00041DAB6B|nr:hypothetical protein [Actinokineospora inagensis]